MTADGYVGNSISNIYDGTNLVSYGGVVFVTANYCLNAFGWFNTSNAALKDTLLALNWVQDNIEAFGSDVCLCVLVMDRFSSVRFNEDFPEC